MTFVRIERARRDRNPREPVQAATFRTDATVAPRADRGELPHLASARFAHRSSTAASAAQCSTALTITERRLATSTHHGARRSETNPQRPGDARGRIRALGLALRREAVSLNPDLTDRLQ